jgi:hypothetical protein
MYAYDNSEIAKTTLTESCSRGPRPLEGKNILIIGGIKRIENLEDVLKNYFGIKKCNQVFCCHNSLGQRKIQETAKNADVLIVVQHYVNHSYQKMAVSSGKNINCIILYDTTSVNSSAMDIINFLYSSQIYSGLARWSKQTNETNSNGHKPYIVRRTNEKFILKRVFQKA